MRTFYKQPHERLDYSMNFSEWLDGDKIESATVDIDNQGISVEAFSFDDYHVKIWLAGGADGEKGKVTCSIETIVGKIKESEFKIKIKEL